MFALQMVQHLWLEIMHVLFVLQLKYPDSSQMKMTKQIFLTDFFLIAKFYVLNLC